MSVATAVEVRGLRREFQSGKGFRKRSRPVLALDGFDLDIAEGEVLGLLGPNGAGKTTLVKVLSTVLLPTSGTARVLGHDIVEETAAVRPLIGIVFGGERGLYTRLTPRQNLHYWAALYKVPSAVGRQRAEELLETVGLTDRADDPVETFSRGMKQRLHLARGLVNDPPVLFLDEPTTGMDPVAAREFRTLVVNLRRQGRTILLTTHDMAEAEALCDRVALIDHGQLLAVETPRVLSGWITRFERIDVEGAPAELLHELVSVPGVTAVDHVAGGARVTVASREATGVVLQRLVAADVQTIRTSLPSLEEVYVHVFGERGLRI
ncbi:MAG: ABC transporter ATP-binding protein [Actinomycetota bacterium]|nr:ABC transporter ATP-binding protein [Actinomycetota bacterium]